MKKPVVDYWQFRPSRLNDPQFSHLKLLGGWILYFASYFLTENLISPDRCHVIHCVLDDKIPFCEYFVIPYVFWYLLIVGSLLYFLLYNVQSFRNLQTYIIITQVVATIIYIVYPSRQDLRPETFATDNFFTQLVGFLYSVDTNTNVCPSLHCAYSIGIASAWLREKGVSPVIKTAIAVAAGLICVSTAFIKQHSVVDFFAAIPVCLLAEYLVYGRKIAYRPQKRFADHRRRKGERTE